MLRRLPRSASHRVKLSRLGATTADYVLGLGVVLPLLAIVLPATRRMMQLVFELSCTLCAWPFM